MKVMAILDKGGIINNIIMCADDFLKRPMSVLILLLALGFV